MMNTNWPSIMLSSPSERHGDSYLPMPFFAPARPQVKFAFLPL